MRAILLPTCRIRFKKLYLDRALGNNNVSDTETYISYMKRLLYSNTTLLKVFYLLLFLS